ncbi:MAG: terminase gpA endonuclease subunit, partial [Opitutae bacterium]
GEGFESWGVRYAVLHGSPLQKGVWEELEDLLTSQFETKSGHALRINAACIDSGGGKGTDTAVYKYTKPRFKRRIFAIKGSSSKGVPIASSKPSYTNRGRAPVYRIGTDEAKRWLFSALKIDEHGYNYQHFPDTEEYDHKYFQMLTAEEQRVRMHKGKRVLEWHQIRQRNEALDCRVYARAALDILDPNWKKLKNSREKIQPSESNESKEPVKNYILKARESAMMPAKLEEKPKPKVKRQPRAAKSWATNILHILYNNVSFCIDSMNPLTISQDGFHKTDSTARRISRRLYVMVGRDVC